MNFDALGKYGALYFKLDRENISSILTCPICFDYFSKPILTPCGHSFCFNCILKHLGMSRNCPMCRNEIEPCDISCNRPLEALLEYLGRTEVINKASASFSLNPFEGTGFSLGKKGGLEVDTKKSKPPFATLNKHRVKHRDENDLFSSALKTINDIMNPKDL